MLIETLLLCGALYAFRKKDDPASSDKTEQADSAAAAELELEAAAPLPQEDDKSFVAQDRKVVAPEQEINRKLVISGLSTALCAGGTLFSSPPLAVLSIPGLLYSSADIFKSAYQAFRNERKLNVDSTIAVVTVVSVANGFLFVCNLNTLLAMTSRKLLLKVKNDSQESVIDVFRQQPQTAWVLADGVEIERPVETLQAEDVVVVKAGETIPVDGLIIFGTASVDQHILTGESQPAEKGPNEHVFALTYVLSGTMHILVEHAGQKTTAAQICRILNQTTNLKTDMQLWAEEAGNKAVPAAMLASGLCLPLLGSGSALAVLNSHPKYKTTITSCIGLLNYLKIASKKGILIKDGRVFERLNRVDTIVFDKTGTLTENKMRVDKIHAYDGYTENGILTLAALAEQRQAHPIAKAVLQEAEARNLNFYEADERAYKIGYGLVVKRKNKTIRVGSVRFIESEELAIPAQVHADHERCQDYGHSLILVAVNDRVVGGIELQAVVRQEVGQVIKGLRQRGISSIYIISGDNASSTKQLSAVLETNQCFAEVLPEDKADLIEQFQQEGRTVCFIGDGINDSIALKKADVSISLRGASTVATDTAQIILMDEGLNHLCALFDLAKEYDANMRMTFKTVLIPHLLGLGGALFLHFNLFHSVILNQIGLALGAGNAMLPRFKHQDEKQEN